MSEGRQYVQLLLTCSDEAEADKVAQSLLNQKLIACAKKIDASSRYRWKGELEEAEEVLLVMDSARDLFDQVEAEVGKLHSYETFVLEAVHHDRISAEARNWLDDNLAEWVAHEL